MRPVKVSVVGVANGGPIPLDQYQSPFNVSLSLSVGSGTILATVQYTFDDIFDPTVTPAWIAHADLTAKTAAAVGTLISPVRAVRLINNDTGTAVLTVVQSGAAG